MADRMRVTSLMGCIQSTAKRSARSWLPCASNRVAHRAFPFFRKQPVSIPSAGPQVLDRLLVSSEPVRGAPGAAHAVGGLLEAPRTQEEAPLPACAAPLARAHPARRA